MVQRIFYDGLNLSLLHGTGVATYSRMLTRVARDLGHTTGVVYSTPQIPSKDPLMREIAFFDTEEAMRIPRLSVAAAYVCDHFRSYLPVKPVHINFSGLVLTDQFKDRLPAQDYVFASRNLFKNATGYFSLTNGFINLAFDEAPDIFHWTYQVPIRAKKALNIYTIHDLVPLRLPFTTLDNKRHTFRLLKKIAATADHIVTVSEHSRRDIIELLGVDEKRVTNTYQAVAFPKEYTEQPQDVIAERLKGTFGLDYQKYLLFFGAVEPKKNVARLIEGYHGSGVDVPLVIVGGEGWLNKTDREVLEASKQQGRETLTTRPPSRQILRFPYVNLSALVTLIAGARAVVFPSLYEGFGLPVLEAMLLGTPVITSRISSLPEVAGKAALFVDPYETADIARAIKRIVADADLRAELSQLGRMQAEQFSVERYRGRAKALYDALA